jgi:hypothetical protein
VRTPNSCARHVIPDVEVNSAYWLGRAAFHVELLVRQLKTDEPIDYVNVALTMAEAFLTDYRALREQQALIERVRRQPCRPCDLETEQLMGGAA